MIDTIKLKDALLNHIIVKDEANGGKGFTLIFKDVSDELHIPVRWIDEILLIFKEKGFIDISEPDTEGHVEIDAVHMRAYDFMKFGGFQAQHVLAWGQLEKLDYELQKLEEEAKTKSIKSSSTMAQLIANIATILTFFKSS